MSPNGVYREVGGLTRSFSENTGVNFNITDTMRDLMESAGFTSITENRLRMPIGPWSTDPHEREIGIWAANFIITGIEGWLLRMLTSPIYGVGTKTLCPP